tara:strand:- start:503 stop:2113 length:1611 start_codon:yes stop_codon:yes gene_type:complete
MYFFYYYIISLAILGYGYLLNSYLRIDTKNEGIIGLNGIFLLILISYISTFILPHNFIFNLIVLSFGLLSLFFYVFYKKHRFNYFLHLLVFVVLFIFVLSGKNHDDFGYYHFPYTHILTQYSHPIGLGVLNNGFRNPSSLFYLNSLFYLPKIEYYLLHIGSAFFLGYTNLFLIRNIFNKKNFKQSKFFNLLNLVFFIFTNLVFYRMSEYGTDRTGQILVILIFINLIYLINIKNDDNLDLFKFLVLIGCITISLKPFYLIYFLLIFYFVFNKDLNFYFFQTIKSRVLILSFTFISFSFLITFLNSGCLIFPLSFTCFENLSWATSKLHVEEVRDWYELWSKGGANPNFTVEDRITYVSNFNWIPNWIENYFFNKVSDFLLSLTIILIIIYFTLKSKKKLNLLDKKYRILYLYLIFFLVEWFINHPTLRYGGFHLFALLIFIPLSMGLEKYELDWNLYFKRSMVLITIVLIIFVSRNSFRLYKEYKVYNYNIFKNLNFKFIGGDENYYLRYNTQIKNKNFNYKYTNVFGKKILIIKR